MDPRRLLAVGTACVCVLLCALPAGADTYTVEWDGSGDYATIQDAIDAVSDTDIIELGDGTFTGDGNRDISFLGKSISVRSQSGDPSACVIDVDGSEGDPHRGFLFVTDEGPDAVLKGVKITGGHIHDEADAGGGGIYIVDASPTIQDCVITGNTATGAVHHCRGGGVAVRDGGSPTLLRCTISSNTCGHDAIGGYGGGVFCYGGSALTMTDCVVRENEARWFGGGVYAYYSTIVMTGCRVDRNACNSGGGVLMGDGTNTLTECVIADNTGNVGGGAYMRSGTMIRCTIAANEGGEDQAAGVHCETDDVELQDCIVAFNRVGGGVFHVGFRPIPTITCTDVYGNEGGDFVGGLADQTGLNGNIAEDPRFCGLPVRVYSLCENSPCLPLGNSCGVQMGYADAGCGDCDSPVTDATWGGIKALYR